MPRATALTGVLAAAIAVLCTLATGPAGATTPARHVSPTATSAAATALPPWQKYRSTPFSYPAGDVCPFALTGTPVRDGEQYRTLQSYPDGNPELNQYRGPLYVRYTNESTGKSVVRNLSGGGFFQFSDAGALTLGVFLNNGGVGVHAGNVGTPTGYYVLHGQFLVQDDSQGNRIIVRVHARQENLCHTLR